MPDTSHCPRCGHDLGRAFRVNFDAGVSTGVQDRIMIDNLRAELGQLRAENKRLRRKEKAT